MKKLNKNNYMGKTKSKRGFNFQSPPIKRKKTNEEIFEIADEPDMPTPTGTHSVSVPVFLCMNACTENNWLDPT